MSGCLKVFCNSAESEAESTALAVPEVYSAYYSEMGGVGAAPKLKARTPTTVGKVERRPKPRLPQAPIGEANDPKVPPGTADFCEMVALIVAY